MKLFTLASAIAISSLLSFASAESFRLKRRDTVPLGQIYAYGTNISGLPVFVGDGTAYIGNVSLSTISGAANVTFEETGTSIIVHKIHDNSTITNSTITNSTTTNSTTANSTTTNSTKYFAVDTTSGASAPVLIANSAAESGYTSDGYFIFGTQITRLTSTRQLESNFYALQTGTDYVWELYWDADSSAITKGTPVVLKAIPPPSIGVASTS